MSLVRSFRTHVTWPHYGGWVCTVVVAWQCVPGAPLVVAANRDELLGRPSEPPLLLSPDPPRWGGRDVLAGGTWLAVDPEGRVAAVTNRHPGGLVPPRDAARQTRGRLPLEALAADDTAALAWMQSLSPTRYNPVNVFYASSFAAYWTALDDRQGRRTAPLTPGIHVLTEQDLDDPHDAKATRLLAQSTAALATSATPNDLISALRQLLSSHETDDAGSPACIHAEGHGTVSSATVLVTDSGLVHYEHADGPPCVTPYLTVL